MPVEPLRMDDGNKESAKELLSTFRVLFSIDVSALFFLVNFSQKGQIAFSSVWLFYFAVSLATVSLMAMIYLFFLTIPKIARSEAAIIYQPDMLITSSVALVSFLASYVILSLDVRFHT